MILKKKHFIFLAVLLVAMMSVAVAADVNDSTTESTAPAVTHTTDNVDVQTATQANNEITNNIEKNIDSNETTTNTPKTLNDNTDNKNQELGENSLASNINDEQKNIPITKQSTTSVKTDGEPTVIDVYESNFYEYFEINAYGYFKLNETTLGQFNNVIYNLYYMPIDNITEVYTSLNNMMGGYGKSVTIVDKTNMTLKNIDLYFWNLLFTKYELKNFKFEYDEDYQRNYAPIRLDQMSMSAGSSESILTNVTVTYTTENFGTDFATTPIQIFTAQSPSMTIQNSTFNINIASNNKEDITTNSNGITIKAPNTKFINNIINVNELYPLNDSSYMIGVYATSTANNLIFTGNTVTVNGESTLYGLKLDSNNNTITNNNIIVTTTGTATGVELTGNDNTVTDNYIVANDKKGDNAVTATGENNVVQDNIPIIHTYIVNDSTVDEIFSGEGNTTADFINPGDILDFQGLIDRNHSLVINKPVNVISSTQDAVINLHTVAGSLMGEDPGNSFVINIGASGSYISGLYLNNTECWVHNVYDATLYNMTMHVQDASVGSGVGQTSLRYCNNVTMDSCYIYTENNGGSSSFVWTGCNNCTIINSTVQGEGNVGNLLYVGNPYNTQDKPANYTMFSQYNNIINCTVLGGSGGISNPLQNMANYTTIQGTKFYSGGSASAGNNGTFIDNEFYRTVSVSMTANCIAHGNIFYDTSKATVAANAQVYNNTFNDVTISGKGAVFEDNTVKGKVTISQPVNVLHNNLADVQVSSNGKTSNITNNIVTGTITSQAADVNIDSNNINTTNDYTVVVTGANNNVTNNVLYTTFKAGDETINTNVATTLIENNKPESGKTVEITDDTYSQFFDKNGKLISKNITTYDTIILKGVFNDKLFDFDTVRVTVQGDEAVINNGFFKSSENASIMLQNLIINNTGNVENSVIFESDSNILRNVTIDRYSREGISQEVYVTGNENVIDNNIFNIDVATQPVNFDNTPSISDVSAITILSSSNKVQKNKINVKTTSNKGTFNVIDIASTTSANSNIIGNNSIDVDGTDYIYGINLGINTNENTVSDNNITLSSDRYAAGIQIMNGPSNNNIVNKNNMAIDATSTAYGILITAWESPEVAGNTFNSNKINVTANQSYGMELYSSNPSIIIRDTTVNSNTIKSEGNYSIGIAFIGENSTISQNTITVTGSSNTTVEDSYDSIKATTAGIILQDSNNINDYNNTINTTNGANHLLINTNNSRVISTTTTMTRYINAENNANIVLKSSNNNVINTQRAYTNGAYSVELTASSDNTIYGNILNASNLLGGNSAVKQDAESKNNIVENNTPVFGLLTEETYASLFDENGVYTYPDGIDILTLAGDLYNKDLTFINNVTFANSKNYTIYNGTIFISENGTQSYTNRFVNINNININNVNKAALVDNLTTKQQRNIQYFGGSITLTGDADELIAIQSVKDNITYAVIDVERVNVNMNGKNVIFAKMTRPELSSNDYIDVENNIITLTSTGNNVVIYDEYVNLDLLKNNITQTGGQATTVYADNGYANGKFFGENNIEITADNASALLLINGRANNPTVGNNNITINSPNPVVAINITTSGNAYVGQGQYTSASYNYPNRIIANSTNGEVPVVTVTENGYVRNNYIMSNDLLGVEAVEAKTVSNITPTTVITDKTYNDFFDENCALKEMYNNRDLTVSGTIREKVFVFDGVNVTITNDGSAKLYDSQIIVGNGATVTFDGIVINNTDMEAIVLESEGNVINNSVIEVNSAYPLHAVEVAADHNTIANTAIIATIPSSDVDYDKDYVGHPQSSALYISSNNNLVDGVAVSVDGSEVAEGSFYPSIDAIDIQSSGKGVVIEGNTLVNTTVIATGSNYVYGINVGRAKDTNIEEVYIIVNSDYYTNGIQLFDAVDTVVTGDIESYADTQAYGVYSTAMGVGTSSNINLTGLDITVEAPDATGVLIEGASNVVISNSTYEISGEKATAIISHIDWMGNKPSNILITGMDIYIYGTEDNSVLYFGACENVTITENSIQSTSGSEININATPGATITDNYILIKDMFTGTFGNYAVITTEEDTIIANNTPTSPVIEELEDELSNLQEQIDSLEEQNAELQAQIDELKKLIEEYAYKDTSIVFDETHAEIDTTVTITGALTDENGNPVSDQTITLTIDDEEVNVTTTDGIFEYDIDCSTLGEKTVTAKYAGTEGYKASEAELTFEVTKHPVELTVDDIADVIQNNNVTITGTLTKADGSALKRVNLGVYINGEKTAVQTDLNGAYTLTVAADTLGENTVKVTYYGNSKYDAKTVTTTFKVTKNPVVLTVDDIDEVRIGDEVTITGTLTKEDGSALKRVNLGVYVNGVKTAIKTDNNGFYTLTVVADTLGENTVKVTYYGNSKYEAMTVTTTFNVLDASASVIVIDEIGEVYTKDNYTVTGTLTYKGEAVASADVEVTIGNEIFTVTTDAKGVFSVESTADAAGTYEVTATYAGDETHDEAAAETTFDVVRRATILTVDDLADVSAGKEVTITGTLTTADGTELKHANVVVSINGKKTSVKTDLNGAYTVTTTATQAGENTVKVTYSGNSKYDEATIETSFNVTS